MVGESEAENSNCEKNRAGTGGGQNQGQSKPMESLCKGICHLYFCFLVSRSFPVLENSLIECDVGGSKEGLCLQQMETLYLLAP